MNYDLKINRENGSYDIINFSFRFNNLDSKTAFEIKNLFTSEEIIFNKPRNKEYYVILFKEINELFRPRLIREIIEKYNLNEADYGFWVSITSEYGHCGGYLPPKIREFYKEIGGQLDFSILIGE